VGKRLRCDVYSVTDEASLVIEKNGRILEKM